MPLQHTITNQIFGWFVRVNGYHDDGEGFGHIDLSGINLLHRYHVVERMVDVLNDTYYIRVTGSFESVTLCNDEIDFRMDYCENYAHGCYSEYEIWDFHVFRYRYYFGGDGGFCESNELPWCLCYVSVLDDGGLGQYFDDAEEAGEYANQLVSEGFRFYEARVSSYEISYLDNLNEVWFSERGAVKRGALRLPLFIQFFTRK